MRILLTGAAGFIGSHAAERLLAEGHAVTGLDLFDNFYDPEIKRRNASAALAAYGRHIAASGTDGAATGAQIGMRFPSSEGGAGGQGAPPDRAADAQGSYELIEGDFGDRGLLAEVLGRGRFDAVLHLAARAGVRPSLEDPLRYEKNNVAGLVALLEALRVHGPKRIVAASSSSVYGNSTPAPFREDAPCLQPQSPYGASKRAGEIYLGLYAKLYGIRAIIVRPFTVYGPRQRPDMAIAAFARKILLGETITLFGDGSSARDYTYVGDIVDGLLGALACPLDFGIYNLGGDRPVRLSELIALLESATGKKAKLISAPMQAGDVEQTCADLTNARKDLAYQPKISIEEGLRRTVAWVKEEFARTQKP